MRTDGTVEMHRWSNEIQRAAARLAPRLPPTPLIRSEYLSGQLGRDVFLKLESLQPVGAFKVRPALNNILARLEECRARGVVTNSSGNFAQAVAFAASEVGVDACIVMMEGASAFKRSRTVAFGGRVVVCDNTFAARAEATERLTRETGRLPVHPFDSVETIAGNGTLGLELLDQMPGDFTLFVPISGGGLIAGVALAVKTGRPNCRIRGVQARANPSMQRSLHAGKPVRTHPSQSLADALTVPEPGPMTFPIVQRFVDDVVLVSEGSMRRAIRTLAVEQKLVVEAGGAVSVAAALADPPDHAEMPIVCLVSGGNIEPSQLRSILVGHD